jgi:hypothetical protein
VQARSQTTSVMVSEAATSDGGDIESRRGKAVAGKGCMVTNSVVLAALVQHVRPPDGRAAGGADAQRRRMAGLAHDWGVNGEGLAGAPGAPA